MTFTEAALEVLRSVGEPLHYKRITELAIERNLLSHVGKTPEVTMSSRLATMVKKDRGSAPIIKVKPGVFAIRADAKLDSDVFAEAAALDDECDAATTASEAPGEPGPIVDNEPAERSSLPGSDVFPEEEDDDDPILAGLEIEESDGGEDRSRRRRRRRRRTKGASEPAPGEEAGNADARTRDRDRGRDRGRRLESRDTAPRLDFTREPGDGDLIGRGLADAVYAVLSRAERTPISYARVADMLVQRGRLSGPGAVLAPTIAAALRAEVSGAHRRGGRIRFLLRDGQVRLTEWLLPTEMVRAEDNTARHAERQREQARRAWVLRINELPVAGFAELIATWLNTEGVSALRAVRRPTSGPQEFHFAGTRRRGPEEERLAIVVLRGVRDIDRETVVRVRGALHHYGNATSAWIVSTGRVSSGARDEVAAITAAPVALFDGLELAAAMESQGIGLRTRSVLVSDLDFDLFEALGGELHLPSAREPRELREPREDRERRRRRRPRLERDTPVEGFASSDAEGEEQVGEGAEEGSAPGLEADSSASGEPTEGSSRSMSAATTPCSEDGHVAIDANNGLGGLERAAGSDASVHMAAAGAGVAATDQASNGMGSAPPEVVFGGRADLSGAARRGEPKRAGGRSMSFDFESDDRESEIHGDNRRPLGAEDEA